MALPHRVVVTGLGVVSPVGNDVATVWSNLLAARSGIGPLAHVDTTGLAVTIGGEVRGFDPERDIGGKDINRMDPCQHFGVAAADQAIAQARIGRDHQASGWDPNRVGVYLGSGIGGVQSWEKNFLAFQQKGARRVSPFLVPMMVSNLIPGNVAIRHGFKGVNFSHVSACATASTAIGEAFRAIRHGFADVVVSGGSEAAITPMTISGFANMKALSGSSHLGAAASRPFDRGRDGFVIAEGAGALILESLESATRRGVEILGEVVGYGATCDAYHQTAPAEGGEGIVRAILLALAEAGIGPDRIGYVNAHGTSTPFNDKHETLALKTALGEHAHRIPVSSTKSMSGHMLGASGALEAIACVLGLREQRIHPTANYSEADPECDLDYVPNEAREHRHEYALSNSMGFGGQNAALVFRRFGG